MDCLKGLSKLHKYLKQQMHLCVATKCNISSSKEIDTILMFFQEKIYTMATLHVVAIVLLYYGLSKATEVQMIQMDYVRVESISSHRIIKVTFKHERKQRNEGFQHCIQSKFYPMFGRYLKEICLDTVAAKNLHFLKNWNKIRKGGSKTPARTR